MLRFIALAAAFLLAGPALAQDATPTRYAVLILEKPAGQQTTTVAADGLRSLSYEFNDRGRGPKLTARVRLDAAGVPSSVEIDGVDYLKAPVNERFSTADGVARWKSESENGGQKITAPGFYLSTQGFPEELGWLAHALLQAPGQRMALLPAGEATIKRSEELTLGDGAKKRHVTSYQIEGLGFAPTTVWLDDDLTFFASLDRFVSVVREGWESSVPKLLEKQEAIASKRTVELARTLSRKPLMPVALTNANLFDSATGKSVPGSTVVIEGNRIRAVGKDGSVAIPSQAQRIDVGGKALLPGLWDMHVHISPNDGLLHLAAGVTSVRDLANDNDALLKTKHDIDNGTEIGPRITMRGFMDGRGPYTGPTKVFVDTEAEARAAIDNYAKLGYDGIKVYSSIKPELLPTIIKLADAKGLRVSGHVPAFMTAQQFIEDGADEIQHINFIFLNFFFDDVKDTRTPQRFIAVAERAATLDLSSERVRSFVQLLKDHNTIVDPTLTAFETLFTNRPGKVSASFAAIADRLPPQVRRNFLGGGRVTIRHGFLDWTLNRTIKTLTGIKPDQADYVLGGEGSASLRRKVRTIAAIRLGKGSDTYKKLKKIIDACDKVTSRRNDFVHSVWVEVEGNTSLFDLRTRNRKPLPKVNEVDSLAKQIHELAERLNEARAKKGFVAVALKESNTTGAG